MKDKSKGILNISLRILGVIVAFVGLIVAVPFVSDGYYVATLIMALLTIIGIALYATGKILKKNYKKGAVDSTIWIVFIWLLSILNTILSWKGSALLLPLLFIFAGATGLGLGIFLIVMRLKAVNEADDDFGGKEGSNAGEKLLLLEKMGKAGYINPPPPSGGPRK